MSPMRTTHRAGGIMGRLKLPLRLLGIMAYIVLQMMKSNAAVVKLDELQVRNLTEQHLQAIPESKDSTSVGTLVLIGNNITLDQRDGKTLATYHGLVELQLGGNQVTCISANFFSGTPNLKVLSLTGNQLSSLDPESFSGLDALTVIDLSYNHLTSLPPKLLSGLKSLQEVNLQGNLWNCSCPLLTTIREIKAVGVTIAPNTTCATAEGQMGRDLSEAVAECYPTPTPTSAKPTLPAPQNTLPDPTTQLQTTPPKATPTQEQGSARGEMTPVLGNTWKFTACVAVLAAFTSALIVGAIKGPSWYKMFHNYRHKRLNNKPDEQEEDGDVASTVFSEARGQTTQRTFVFETEAQGVDAEDEYFEDPYIRRDE